MVKNALKIIAEIIDSIYKVKERKFEKTSVKSVLIIHIKPLGFGDLIMSNPGLQLISKNYKTSILTSYTNLLNKKDYKEIIQWPNDLQSQIKLMFKLRKKYDLVISNSKADNQNILSKFLTKKYHIGYKKGWILNSNFNTSQYRYEVEQHYVNLIQNICKSIDLNTSKINKIKYSKIPSKQFQSKELTDEDYIVITPNVAWKSRTYPVEKLIEAIKELKKLKKYKIVMIGHGDEDEKTGKKIEEECRVINKISILNLNETAHLLSNAKLHICGDCGPMHIGFCQETPTIALFGPIDPKTRLPLYEKEKFVGLWKGDKPMYDLETEESTNECKFIEQIEPKEIIRIARKILNE